MSDLSDRIVSRLLNEFSFKIVGEWLRDGICPHCNKKSLWTHGINPRVVTCNRIAKCGYNSHVRDLYDDMFKSWSEHHPQTQENPNAAADAYLAHGRGLDISKIKGCYTQEVYEDKKLGITTATVRFKLSNGDYWQRLIDRPERFGDKARFNFGAKAGTTGVWFVPPFLKLIDHTEIWITEGIFDALALAEHGIAAVSCLSSNNYPTQGLATLFEECKKAGIERPKIVWAFDNDIGGHGGTMKNHERATEEGWESIAAQPPRNATIKIDWNDLHERDRLTPKHLKDYLYFGELLLVPTASAAGLLIYNRRDGARKQFPFFHRMRLYWFNLDIDKFHKQMENLEKDSDRNGKKLDDDTMRAQALNNCSAIVEICNAYIEPLYFQRNVVTDESWYYIKIVTKNGDVKSKFTGDQISSPTKFKPRLLGIYPGVLWTGTSVQLDYCLKNSIEGLREVQTIDYIGYSKLHRTYIFPKIAVSKGQAIELNQHDFFKIGKVEVKSLALSPEIELNIKTKFDPKWYPLFWRVRGAKGLIAMAWWMGSYFAEQIRERDSSYPFMELVGEPGAGKSRLITFLWKLSGRADYEGFNPNKGSKVGLYRNFAQVSNLPVCLIEGDKTTDDKTDQQKFDWDELKDAFNGRPIRSIGRKTSGHETYEPPFRGAIMISQNDTIKASEAIITRITHLTLDRKGQSLETKRLVDELDKISLEQACTFMTHCLRQEDAILKTYSEKVTQYENEYHSKGISHTRVALCHAQIAALVDALAIHVLNDAIDLEHVIEATDMLVDMARDRVQRLTSDHPLVTNFWDVYDYLAGIGNIAINHHNETANTIAINLPQFFKFASDHRQQLPDITRLKDLLKTSTHRKYLDHNRVVRSANIQAIEERRAARYQKKAQGNDNNPVVDGLNIKCWVFQKSAGDR